MSVTLKMGLPIAVTSNSHSSCAEAAGAELVPSWVWDVLVFCRLGYSCSQIQPLSQVSHAPCALQLGSSNFGWTTQYTQVRETWEFLLSQSVLLFLGWTGSISERFAPNPNGRHQPQRLAGWDDTHFSAGNPGAGLPIGIFKKLSNSYYASAQKPMQLCGLEHLDHLKLLQKSRMLL